MITFPDPFNDDLGLDDADLVSEVQGHAAAIAASSGDTAAWCVRLTRMRDRLQELHGKPIVHGDFRASAARAVLEEGDPR